MNPAPDPKPQDGLAIRVSVAEGVIRISAVGRIVHFGNSDKLGDAFRTACQMQLGQRIEADLTGVVLIDAAGVTKLIVGMAQARRAGLGFKVKPSPFIAKTLRICRLYDLLVSPCAGGRP